MNDFDNHDKRIPYYELLLERDLDSIPKFSLTKYAAIALHMESFGLPKSSECNER